MKKKTQRRRREVVGVSFLFLIFFNTFEERKEKRRERKERKPSVLKGTQTEMGSVQLGRQNSPFSKKFNKTIKIIDYSPECSPELKEEEERRKKKEEEEEERKKKKKEEEERRRNLTTVTIIFANTFSVATTTEIGVAS